MSVLMNPGTTTLTVTPFDHVIDHGPDRVVNAQITNHTVGAPPFIAGLSETFD